MAKQCKFNFKPLAGVISAVMCAALPLAAHADFEYELSADAMLDAVSYSGSEFSESGQELYLRRANLGIELEYNKLLNAEISGEYSELDEEYSFKDVYVGITPLKLLELRVGRFKEPAGLERNQGLKNQVFLERSLATNVFSFGRKTGIGVIVDGDGWNVEGALMNQQGKDEGYDDSRVLALHASYNPYRNDAKTDFLHIGTSYSKRDATERRYDIDEPTVAPIYGNTIHSQRYRDADITSYGFEGAVGYKKLLLQAEYFDQTFNEADGDEYIHTGYYLTGSYTLLGGARQYRKGEVKSNKDAPQILEIAARISQADTVNDGEGDSADVASLIVNYYPTKNYRLALEYAASDIQSYDNNVPLTLDGQAITARIQLSF